MMKSVALIVILFFFCGTPTFSQNWFTNFEEAKLEAQKTGHPIFLLFSGSDWCAPCIRLKKEILSDSLFVSRSNEFVLFNADFPRKKQKNKELLTQNEALAEKFNKGGAFPLIVLLNPFGKKIGTLHYENDSPQTFLDRLDRSMAQH